ncbi:MAG: TraR/DksA C4-type zinc finger protein [Planctomycetota bacterium]
MLARTLHCAECGWRTVAGAADLAARLRLVGQLRRDKDPSDELIAELLPSAAKRMTCPLCKSIGLRVGDPTAGDEFDDEFSDAAESPGDWQAAVLCEVCREPIDPERLEFVPDAKRCVACQGKAEAGALEEDEPEFCPKCGSLVELRVSRGSGLTRYKRFCTGIPPCRL